MTRQTRRRESKPVRKRPPKGEMSTSWIPSGKFTYTSDDALDIWHGLRADARVGKACARDSIFLGCGYIYL